MWIWKIPCRELVAVLTAFSLIAAPGVPLLAAPLAPAASVQNDPAPGVTTAAASTDADVDLGWPRTYQTPDGATITVYQPQVESWEGERKMKALAAVSYLPPGATTPSLGVITIDADTSVSLEERLVHFSSFSIPELNFPDLSRDQLRELASELVAALPEDERIIALDRVLESVDNSKIRARNVDDLRANPPRIFWSTREAILVALDGDPVWAPIQGLDLEFAVNTNWDLFRVMSTDTLYLRSEAVWLRASALSGPWESTRNLPSSFESLPNNGNWVETKANLPKSGGPAPPAPEVFTSTTPAELIELEGEPKYTPVEGTGLLWVSNTQSDLFRMGQKGDFFYLVAGRWFRAASLDGPWMFATPTLPEDFRRIPVDFERSRVLASVPGTEQANEAILLAEVPQTARVNKNEIKAPTVSYQGDPEFQPIATTSLERAVNTDKDIVKAGDLYYMCFQGVWFMSRNPTGPWEVATTIPPEIYKIPPSSPVYNVTYVTVQNYNPNDQWVTFAYTAGYTGMMIAWGTLVWGTGWYYPPYIWYGPRYPVYYHYPVTYGIGAWYNPWTGAYGRGGRVYGPYGGTAWGAVYNPRTGTYARGAAAYGPYNARAAAQAWNPRTGTYAQTRQGANVYGSWGSTSVVRGDNWANTRRVTNAATGTTTRVTRTDQGTAVSRRGQQGFVAAGSGGDVYAGQDGNVYRRQDGSWQKYENGGWSNVDTSGAQQQAQNARAGRAAGQAPAEIHRPTLDQSTMGQLDRDSASRSMGAARTNNFNNYRSGGGQRSRAGSYGGFGGMRGGGRLR